MTSLVQLSVTAVSDVEQARRAARALARAQGFDLVAAEGVTLAVSELATNLVRYARGGQITLLPLIRPGGPGIEVQVEQRKLHAVEAHRFKRLQNGQHSVVHVSGPQKQVHPVFHLSLLD